MNCPLDGATLRETGGALLYCYQCDRFWKWVVLDDNGDPILDPGYFRRVGTYKVKKELREVKIHTPKPLHGSGMRFRKS